MDASTTMTIRVVLLIAPILFEELSEAAVAEDDDDCVFETVVTRLTVVCVVDVGTTVGASDNVVGMSVSEEKDEKSGVLEVLAIAIVLVEDSVTLLGARVELVVLVSRSSVTLDTAGLGLGADDETTLDAEITADVVALAVEVETTLLKVPEGVDEDVNDAAIAAD